MKTQVISNTSKTKVVLFLLLSVVLALFSFKVHAQNSDQANKDAAMKELSAVTGENITNKDDAKKICNLEKFMTSCAEIGKKYNLYKVEAVAQVDAVLEEMKGNIVSDLKSCSNDGCLIDVANKIAKQMASRNPEIASKFDLTSESIKSKQAVIMKAKELGVSAGQCRELNLDTAPVETLRNCAKLAKDESVKQYIPEANRKRIDQIEPMLKLKNALAEGKYQCGDNTPEGCGNFCMNPPAEVKANGANAISQVCRDIAKEFFGPEGVKQLEDAYSQIGQIQDFYKKRADNITFVTEDGRKLSSPEAVGQYLEEQGNKGNVGAVEKGLDFMVTNGFIKSEDKDFALKMVKQFSTKGVPADFNKCRENPENCRDLIPQDLQKEFQVKREAEQIMREEMAKAGILDPSLCQDPANGDKCVAASQNAIPRLETIQNKSPETIKFVSEIKQNVQLASQGLDAKKRIETEFQKNGDNISMGGRQFSNFQEMQSFCSTNGATCLTEATKQGFISGDFAAQKYSNSLDKSARIFSQPNFEGGPLPFPGQGATAGQFPGQNPQGYFPGQGFGFIENGQNSQQFSSQGFSGNGFNKEEALKQFKAWSENPTNTPPPTFPIFNQGNFQNNSGQTQQGAKLPQPPFPNEAQKQQFQQNQNKQENFIPSGNSINQNNFRPSEGLRPEEQSQFKKIMENNQSPNNNFSKPEEVKKFMEQMLQKPPENQPANKTQLNNNQLPNFAGEQQLSGPQKPQQLQQFQLPYQNQQYQNQPFQGEAGQYQNSGNFQPPQDQSSSFNRPAEGTNFSPPSGVNNYQSGSLPQPQPESQFQTFSPPQSFSPPPGGISSPPPQPPPTSGSIFGIFNKLFGNLASILSN